MKLIGLVPVRNAEGMIEQCLRALAMLCDEIIVLDDFSEDQTVHRIESLAASLRITSVLTKKAWHRDEPGDRNRLLQEGRKRGGTHFVVIDADEAFTGSWVTDGTLRKLIADLAKGDRLLVRWIHPWRSLDYVRWDDSVQSRQFKDVIFCDDVVAQYESDFIHTLRSPSGLRGIEVKTQNHDEGLLHFQYVCWRNVLIKQAWYHCLERVRVPDRPSADINARYASSCDETGLSLRPTPTRWVTAYPFLTRASYDLPDNWRLEQMEAWFRQYGTQQFQDLNIWHSEIWPHPSPEVAAAIKSAHKAIREERGSGYVDTGNGEGHLANLGQSALSEQPMLHEINLLRAQLADLKKNFDAVERDRIARGEVITDQGRKLTLLEAEIDTRLKELHSLYLVAETTKNERNLLRAQLADLRKNFDAVEKDWIKRGEELHALYAAVDTTKNERNLLQAQLADLRKNFASAEKDRVERGKVIAEQGLRSSALEGEIDKRLKELHALHVLAESTKNERNLLQAQLADLRRNFDATEKDRIARGEVINNQGNRIAYLEELVWLTEQNRDWWKAACERQAPLTGPST